jgi:hypothetical protein
MALVNVFGKLGLDGTMQKIAQYLQQIAANIGRMYPDTSGRMRVNVEAGTINTVTSVTSMTTLNNQQQQSGYFTNYDQYAQLQMCANGIRSQIKVTP